MTDELKTTMLMSEPANGTTRLSASLRISSIESLKNQTHRMKLNGSIVIAAICAFAVSAQAVASSSTGVSSTSKEDGTEEPRFQRGLTTAEPAPGDKQESAKIEALLKNLENLKDASFIRNDTALQPKEAAALMRKKLQSMPKEIKTANDFIEKIMTASSSGAKKPYLLRFKDGKETKCADYLKAELRKLDTKPTDGK